MLYDVLVAQAGADAAAVRGLDGQPSGLTVYRWLSLVLNDKLFWQLLRQSRVHLRLVDQFGT